MKKILMLLAFAGVASVASAQQTMTVTEYEVIQVQDKYQVITNPFWSNWFFSVGGGAQVLYGNHLARLWIESDEESRSAKTDLPFFFFDFQCVVESRVDRSYCNLSGQ